jgi:hypothetical protein
MFPLAKTMPRQVRSLTLVVVLVLTVTACRPSGEAQLPAPASALPVQATQAPAQTVAPQVTGAPGIEATSAPAVLPVATSRGPSLEATDPSTVALASGGLQLVEFFRFT